MVAKLRFDEITFQFVFKGTPEIVPEDELKKVAKKYGFEVVEGERVFRSPIGEIVRLNIGRKGGVDLLYDPRESFIGLGTQTGDLNILYSHVKNTLDKMIDELEIRGDVKFYRVTARGRSWYGKDTKSVFKGAVKIENLEKIKKVINLGINLQPMTIRLIPADKPFGELPWIDIAIEPLVVNTKYFYYSLAYLDENYEKCLSLLNGLSSMLDQILDCIGGE